VGRRVVDVKPTGLAKWNSRNVTVAVLGAFAKLRKAIISFVMSVCPLVCKSVRLSSCNICTLSGRIFMKIDISGLYENLSRKSEFYLNMTRLTGTSRKDVGAL
jgi:hypothetical protein